MNTQAYIDIAKRIREAVGDTIIDIDIYNQQYQQSQEHNSYNYPAVYIEFDPNNWNDNNDKTQQGLGGFKVHVVVSMMDETRNIDQQDRQVQATALANLDVPQQVHNCLNNPADHWMPAGCITPLERVDDTPDHNFDQKLVFIYHYTAIMLDTETGYYDAGNWQGTRIQTIKVTGGITFPLQSEGGDVLETESGEDLLD